MGSTQGSGAPGTLKSTAPRSPYKRVVAASSARRHRYNYRDYSNAEDDNKGIFASPLADSKDKDLSDVKVVEKFNSKPREEGLGKQEGGEVLDD